MRFTPAGIPAIDLTLEHESEQEEAGQMRKVKCSIKAVAIGPLAETLSKQALGTEMNFTGFIAARSSNKGTTKNFTKGTVLHLQIFTLISQ